VFALVNLGENHTDAIRTRLKQRSMMSVFLSLGCLVASLSIFAAGVYFGASGDRISTNKVPSEGEINALLRGEAARLLRAKVPADLKTRDRALIAPEIDPYGAGPADKVAHIYPVDASQTTVLVASRGPNGRFDLGERAKIVMTPMKLEEIAGRQGDDLVVVGQLDWSLINRTIRAGQIIDPRQFVDKNARIMPFGDFYQQRATD